MARLIRRLDHLEEPPEAYAFSKAMEFLSDAELGLLIAYGRRALAAAEAGLDRERPSPEEAEALERHAYLAEDVREGLLG